MPASTAEEFWTYSKKPAGKIWSKPFGTAVIESTAGTATSGVNSAIEASTANTTVPRKLSRARALGDK
jgi:hypothetical protein